jgi:hypothetical protein
MEPQRSPGMFLAQHSTPVQLPYEYITTRSPGNGRTGWAIQVVAISDTLTATGNRLPNIVPANGCGSNELSYLHRRRPIPDRVSHYPFINLVSSSNIQLPRPVE